MQCFRCGHKWHERVAGDEAVARGEPDAAPSASAVPDFVIRPQDHGDRERVSLPTVPPDQGLPTWLKVLLGLVILIGIVGGIGFALRDELAPLLPGMAKPDATDPGKPRPATPPTGAPATAPPGVVPPIAPPGTTAPPTRPAAVPALELQNVRVAPVLGAPGRSIMVTGDIVNTGTGEATPRRLKLTFKDLQGKAVGERTFELKPEKIAPQGRQPFEQRVDDAAVGAVNVDMTVE